MNPAARKSGRTRVLIIFSSVDWAWWAWIESSMYPEQLWPVSFHLRRSTLVTFVKTQQAGLSPKGRLL